MLLNKKATLKSCAKLLLTSQKGTKRPFTAAKITCFSETIAKKSIFLDFGPLKSALFLNQHTKWQQHTRANIILFFIYKFRKWCPLELCSLRLFEEPAVIQSPSGAWQGYKAARKKRAFRYATSNPCRVPTARYPSTSSIPAIEMAGYHCLMPTASLAGYHCQMPMASLAGYHCQMPTASLASYRIFKIYLVNKI